MQQCSRLEGFLKQGEVEHVYKLSFWGTERLIVVKKPLLLSLRKPEVVFVFFNHIRHREVLGSP